MFDVTMASYDGAETCELIGIYMLSLVASKFKDEVGLYRDDGLAVCKATPKEIEKTKKEVCNVFKSKGLKITIDANKKIVHFLDVTFDLTDGSYKPYMKPNNKLSYVHQQSNHPPALLKNIPLNINKRLTNISSSKEVFDESIAPYQHGWMDGCDAKFRDFGFKSDTAVLTFNFCFLSSPLFSLFLLIFFSLAGHLVGFILMGRVFRKAFRIVGLGERKGRWAMEQDFHADLQVNLAWFFAFFSGILD